MLEKLQQFSALTPKPKVLTQSLREVPRQYLHIIPLPHIHPPSISCNHDNGVSVVVYRHNDFHPYKKLQPTSARDSNQHSIKMIPCARLSQQSFLGKKGQAVRP